MNPVDEQLIDQVIEAMEKDELDKAVMLVRGATRVSPRQAMDIVLTLMEGLDEADRKGLTF